MNMLIDNTQVFIDRVEIHRKVFDEKGYCAEEQIEYYYPEGKEKTIKGFEKSKNKVK